VLLSRYLVALVLTLVVEVPLYSVALRTLYGRPWRTGLVAGTVVNLVTHPALWYGLRPWRGHPGYPRLLVIVEIGACLIEWLLLLGALVLVGRPGPGARLALAGGGATAGGAVGGRVAGAALLAVVVVGVNAASVLAGLALPG
jgi:hypothetical protein